MSKPILNKIGVFDANEGTTFTFSYFGNQPYKNRLIIVNSVTNETVTDTTVESMKFSHTIAGGLLENNVSYSAQISVFDENNKESALSDKAYFSCYAKPVFYFNNLSSDSENQIAAAVYQASVFYQQEQSRNLKLCRFYLYDSSKMNTLEDSGELTDGSNTYTYRHLDNKTLYYIRCTGCTVDDVFVDTGYVSLYVSYINSDAYTLLNLTSSSDGGYIQIHTDISLIDGKPFGEVSLSDGTAAAIHGGVIYQEGFVINDGTKWYLKLKNPVENTLVAYQTNHLDTVKLYYYKYESMSYLKLDVTNWMSHYIRYTPLFHLKENETVSIYITRENNLYQINVLQETQPEETEEET